jgi:hypothetical protein
MKRLQAIAAVSLYFSFRAAGGLYKYFRAPGSRQWKPAKGGGILISISGFSRKFCNFIGNKTIFCIIQAQNESYTYEVGSNEFPGAANGQFH